MAYTVKGKSIKDILSISSSDFSHLSKRELKSAVVRLNSAANKRLKRFEARGDESPAVRKVYREGNVIQIEKPNMVQIRAHFSTKGKDTLNDLRKAFMQVKGFLEAETSTYKGWEHVKKTTMEKIAIETGTEMSTEQYNTFWRIYEELKERDPSIIERGYKYKVLEAIQEKMGEGLPPDEVINTIFKKLDEIYERDEGSSHGSKSVSSFFK